MSNASGLSETQREAILRVLDERFWPLLHDIVATMQVEFGGPISDQRRFSLGGCILLCLLKRFIDASATAMMPDNPQEIRDSLAAEFIAQAPHWLGIPHEDDADSDNTAAEAALNDLFAAPLAHILAPLTGSTVRALDDAVAVWSGQADLDNEAVDLAVLSGAVRVKAEQHNIAGDDDRVQHWIASLGRALGLHMRLFGAPDADPVGTGAKKPNGADH
jgi:hypothetical protein